MATFIIRRLIVSLILLGFISIISFFIVTLTPGSPYPWGDLNPKISCEMKDIFRKKFHLDLPIPEQYALIMRDLFTGKLCSMKDERPVLSRIMERLPATLALNFTAIIISCSFGTLLGVYTAKHAGKYHDMIGSLVAFLLIALPSFLLAYLVAIILVNRCSVPILGSQSYGILFPNIFSVWCDRLWHLLLPATILGLGGLAAQSRFLRANIIETLRADYIRTARSKGLSEETILLKHALKNSIRPLITSLGMMIPSLLGGSIIIETIFAYPGMGRLQYEAVLERDYPTIVTMNFIVAALILCGNLIADILYAMIDPRVHLE